MKLVKMMRIFGVALVMALTIATLPAVPALAVAELTLSPSSGKIGDTITISGTGFSTSTNEKHSIIYFSADSAIVNNDIDNQVTRYKTLADVVVEEDGTFSQTFTVPSVLNDGATSVNVQAGTTYYIYVTFEYFSGDSTPTKIKALRTFTVSASAALDPLSPASGPAGTDVTISGANFPASATIIIKYDGTAVPIKTGDTVVRTSGIFISTITAPSGSTGAHTITVTAGSATATATFTVTASAALDPLLPASGPAGADVTISGANFLVSYPIIFKFDTTTIAPKLGDINTKTSGSFNSIITVPASSTAGVHTIYVTVGTVTVNATFTVTGTSTPPPTPPPAPAPTPTPTPSPSTATLSINSSTGYVGSNLLITGIGFAAGKTVTIKYEGEAVATANADTNGLFVAAFKIPASKGGDHTITASDGTNSKEMTFTVETVAPKIPQPLQPEMGVNLKSPILFKWGQVTDDSAPVTYELQIASDEDFDAKSLELEKELTQTEYTLTAEEEKDLAGKETPYYWRIRAVDAAENASQWTGAGEFSITPPFSIPDWALYTIIGLAGIFLFAIGLLIGRRTAFNY